MQIMQIMQRTGIERKVIAGSEFKVDDGEQPGTVSGYLNRTGQVDLGFDKTIPGCFKQTIKDAERRRAQEGGEQLWPLLWAHNTEIIPPGNIVSAWEDKSGLFIKARLNLDYQLGADLYSAFKHQTVKGLSMGYKTLDYAYIHDAETGKTVRELKQVDILEGSVVLMPMSPGSQVTSVKRYWPGWSSKGSASGKTTWPLADRNTRWDGSQARKDIQAYARNGDTMDWAKVASCHFWVANSPPTKLEDCKFPFVARVGGEMKAVPAAIFNGAARLSSADIDDVDGVKAKMAVYYHKMKLPTPWEKGNTAMSVYTKDFTSNYQSAQLDDWCYDDFGDLASSLKASIQECFTAGNDPMQCLETDVLPQLADALRAYVQQGVSLGYTGGDSSGMDMPMGMMSMSGAGRESKAGYLNASDHAAIKESSTMIMKHAKIIASASANVERANARARAGQLAGWPVYGSMSEPSIFEQKEAEEDTALQIKLLTTSLEFDNAAREAKDVLAAQDPLTAQIARVEEALARVESKRH